jgi:hypothetical protein
MKNHKLNSLILTVTLVILFSGTASAQWATIVRKVKAMHTPKTDIASVMVEAGTARVYQTVLDTLGSSRRFTVLKKTPAERQVEFMHGTYEISLQVDSLAANLAQITVVSDHSDSSIQSSTNIAIDAIIAVCNKIGVKCTVEK